MCFIHFVRCVKIIFLKFIMPFFVIQYVENGEKNLCTVPSTWVSTINNNETIVKWPQMRFIPKSMLRNEKSIPDKSWNSQTCQIKRKYQSYREAYKDEVSMCTKSDTEGQQGDSSEESNDGKFMSQNLDHNFNYAIPQEYVNEYPNALEIQLSENSNNFQGNFNSENGSAQPVLLVSEGNSTVCEDIAGLRNEISILTKEVKLLSNIVLQWDTKLDIIAKLAETQKENEITHVPEDFRSCKITTLEGIENLEKRLNNPDEMNLLIKQLATLVGDNKARLSPQKVFSMVLDALIDRDILVHFSWTGTSKNGKKENFISKKNILHSIFQVISLSNKNYTIAENEKNMHYILRNSVSRLNQKCELKRKGLLEKNTSGKLGKSTNAIVERPSLTLSEDEPSQRTNE